MQIYYNIKIIVFEEIGSHRIGDDWKEIGFNHEFFFIRNIGDLNFVVKKIKRSDIIGCLGLTYNFFYSGALVWAATKSSKIHVFSEGFPNFSLKRSFFISFFPWQKTTLFGIGRDAVQDYLNHCFLRSIDNYIEDFAYPFDLEYPYLSDDNRLFFSTYCGQLITRKNVESFLRFAQRVLTYDSNAKFQIIGDGPYRNRLKTYCDELGITQNVIWVNNLSRKAVLDALKNSKSLFLNSHYEGWGAVSLEAMSCGCFLILGKNVRSNILVSCPSDGVVFLNEKDLDVEEIMFRLKSMKLPQYKQIQNRSRRYSSTNLYKILINDDSL